METCRHLRAHADSPFWPGPVRARVNALRLGSRACRALIAMRVVQGHWGRGVGTDRPDHARRSVHAPGASQGPRLFSARLGRLEPDRTRVGGVLTDQLSWQLGLFRDRPLRPGRGLDPDALHSRNRRAEERRSDRLGASDLAGGSGSLLLLMGVLGGTRSPAEEPWSCWSWRSALAW